MDKEKDTVESKEVDTENLRELGTETVDSVEREMKEEGIVDIVPTSSGAAEPDARPQVELLKSTMKK